MLQADAETAICVEWDRWLKSNPDGRADGVKGFIFFGYLQQSRRDLLEFRYGGDKWQRVKGWLANSGRIQLMP